MVISSTAILTLSFALLAVAFYLGRRYGNEDPGIRDGLRLILGATLSLLALLIGFTLSMAIGGYNARQAAEEAEATAVRTAYLRAQLLSEDDGQRSRVVLSAYLANRIRAYELDDPVERGRARHMGRTSQLRLWNETARVAKVVQTPITSLVVMGINDVLTSQQKARAAWRNQIPAAAWILLFVIAALCNVMLGYDTRNVQRRRVGLLWVLPLVISLSFFMIADIDMPGAGIIRVAPVNLRHTEAFIAAASQSSSTTPDSTNEAVDACKRARMVLGRGD